MEKSQNNKYFIKEFQYRIYQRKNISRPWLKMGNIEVLKARILQTYIFKTASVNSVTIVVN